MVCKVCIHIVIMKRLSVHNVFFPQMLSVITTSGPVNMLESVFLLYMLKTSPSL